MKSSLLSPPKGLLILGLVLAFLLLRTPLKAYAHFPATDGNMTVILHVDPEDDPIPGQPATLDFIFDDSTNRFQLTKCLCNLSIAEQGKVLYQSALFEPPSNQPSVYGAALGFTFPNRDVYHITLSSNPVDGGTFAPFSLSWNFRVDQQPLVTQSSSAQTFLNYFVAIFAVFLVAGVIVFIAA